MRAGDLVCSQTVEVSETSKVLALRKAIAASGQTRVPEIVLLALAAAGGWPLAYLSMRLFHHKTSAEKVGFRTMFWLLVIVDIVLFMTYIWPSIEPPPSG